jgi:hypothetical protein
MPLKKCREGGKSGWKYGDSGKCYTGPGAKKKAIKQGIAIDGPDGFKAEAELFADELDQAIAEMIAFGPDNDGGEFEFDAMEAVLAYVSQKERDKMSSDDFGWPEKKKYPVKDQKHLDAAVKLLGRAPKNKQAAIKKRLKQIAKRKGLKLPKEWENEKDE